MEGEVMTDKAKDLASWVAIGALVLAYWTLLVLLQSG